MAPVSRGGSLLYQRVSGAEAHVCYWANLRLGLGISVVKQNTGYVSKTTFVIDHLPDVQQIRATCVIYCGQLLFYNSNLFILPVPRDKVRLFGIQYLIQRFCPEWIIGLKCYLARRYCNRWSIGITG